MWIKDALDIARPLVEEMSPFCERIEIAGSIRRGCQGVKDVELVAIPRWELGAVIDLFGTTDESNSLHAWALDAERRGLLRWIKTGTSEIEPWTPKPEGKYWRALLREDVKLDLFLPRQDNFGLLYLIRTGHKEFSSGVLGHAKRNTGYQTESSYFKEHGIKDRGEPECYLVEKKRWGCRVETPEERDVFELLNLEWVEPRDRVGFGAVRPRPASVAVV